MTTDVDDESPFGTYVPGRLRQRVHAVMDGVYRCGYPGRRLFGRLRWLENLCTNPERQIVDVSRFNLAWRTYRKGNVADSRLLLRPGSLEPVEINTILEAVEPGFVFIDIGANCGFFALRVAAALSSDGKVIAIEPHPSMRKRLAYNKKINSLEWPRIHGCAIGDHNGVARLEEGTRNLGTTRVSDTGTIEVSMRTLLDITEEEKLDRVDAVKVDVEGFEDRVLGPFLRDAPDSLLPRLIVAEYSWGDAWKEDWIGRAKSRGYREARRTRNRNVILVRE